jgi:transcriptional regulator of acetoin/glycerol metabolism
VCHALFGAIQTGIARRRKAPIVRATTGASPSHYCTGGRITAACADPGLPRKTLYDKMRRLGISREIEDGGK